MKDAFLLSKRNIELSKYEVLYLLNIDDYKINNNLLVIDTNKNIGNQIKRLAYTKKAYCVLFETNYADLMKKIKTYAWKKAYKSNFRVRITNLTNKKIKHSEKDLASCIWINLEKNKIKPKVKLDNPKTKIEVIFAPKKVFCCIETWENKEKFELRKAHLRPELHPTSLDPRLARCLVNMTGAKKGSIILDPFCGSGGILIEAGLAGLKPIGCDIDQIMLNRAGINLDYYRIRGYKLKKQDATEIKQAKQKTDYVVTDLPYGKNTKQKDLVDIYDRFLKNLKKIVKKRAVVVLPDIIDYKRLIKTNKLTIMKEFSYYLHKSLSKSIVIIKN